MNSLREWRVLIFETLFAAQMTGINRKNGSLSVNLSFATKRQFRSKMPISQQLRNAFRSCQMRAPVLRSGTRVPKSPSQLRKFSQRTPKCCGMVWQQNAHFAEVSFTLRNFAELCFSSVFALFLLRFRSDFFLFNFLEISSTWDHSKRLKHI